LQVQQAFTGQLREDTVKKTDSDSQTTTVVIETESQATATAAPSVDEAVFRAAGLSAIEARVLRLRTGAVHPEGVSMGSKLDGVTDPVRLADLRARLALLEAEALAHVAPAADEARKQRIIAALKAKSDQAVEVVEAASVPALALKD
jgi:hypothetical protein